VRIQGVRAGRNVAKAALWTLPAATFGLPYRILSLP